LRAEANSFLIGMNKNKQVPRARPKDMAELLVKEFETLKQSASILKEAS
jgi:hypothetical protein